MNIFFLVVSSLPTGKPPNANTPLIALEGHQIHSDKPKRPAANPGSQCMEREDSLALFPGWLIKKAQL